MTLKPKAELISDLCTLINNNVDRLEEIQDTLLRTGEIEDCAWELHRALEESLAINNLGILIGWMEYSDVE